MKTHFISVVLCLLSFLGCMQTFKRDKLALKEAIEDFNARQFDSCETKLLAYTTKFPEDDQGWCFLGTVALELDQDSLATTSYKRSLALNPKDYRALTGLGVLERKKDNDKKAADYYRQAIFINPAYAKAYSSLLIVELKERNYENAVQLGEKALSLDSYDLGIKGNLAIAYHFTKRHEERDALMKELEQKAYPYLIELNQLIIGEVTLDDL